MVRNGYLPERKIVTGLGEIEVCQPRVADCRPEGDREAFSSKILPPYLRKTKSIEELIPWLYLKGISTGGFHEALQSILGPECPGLAATTITRLKRAYKTLYKSGLSLEQARRELARQVADCPEVQAILDFLADSTRGIIR